MPLFSIDPKKIKKIRFFIRKDKIISKKRFEFRNKHDTGSYQISGITGRNFFFFTRAIPLNDNNDDNDDDKILAFQNTFFSWMVDLF